MLCFVTFSIITANELEHAHSGHHTCSDGRRGERSHLAVVAARRSRFRNTLPVLGPNSISSVMRDALYR